MSQFLSSWKHAFVHLPVLFAAALCPFLFFPFFLDVFEVHKAIFAILASMVSGILFLAMTMKRHVLHLSFTRWLLPAVAFSFSSLASALFSSSPAMSWMGFGGGDYGSVFFLFSCVLTIFLFLQLGKDSLKYFVFIRYFWSLGSLVVFALLLLRIFGVPLFSPSLSFGTPHALALFLGVGALLWMGELLQGSVSSFTRSVTALHVFFLFLVAFFLDSWVLWIPLFLTGIFLFTFFFMKQSGKMQFSLLLLCTSFIVLPFVGFLLPQLFDGLFPAEVVPSFALSVDVVKGVWSSGLGFFFGSGSGTYGMAYALYALPEVNTTLFWNVFFDRGFSHVLTLATTMGFFGALSFVLMQISGIVVGFRAVSQAQTQQGVVLGAYLAFLFLTFSAWFYSWNVGITFLFFVLLGFLFSLGNIKIFSSSLSSSPRTSFFASLSFITALILFCLVLFISGTRYAAEIVYARAMQLQRADASPEEILLAVDRAASYNQWNDMYYRELSILLLQRVQDLVVRQASDEQIQGVLSASINAAVRATEIAPNNVRNWEVRGAVYREVAPVVASAADFSLASYTTAVGLAPQNPYYRVGLGRAYLTKADYHQRTAQSGDEAVKTESLAARDLALLDSEKVFLEALSLKPDYADARYFLSAVYERQGKVADAIAQMEIVRALRRDDVGIGMQLALLYLRQGRNESAQRELERILALVPTYANARWYLSVVLEQQGDISGALLQLEEILKTNPDNDSVLQRIDRLRSGEIADDAALPAPLETSGNEMDNAFVAPTLEE